MLFVDSDLDLGRIFGSGRSGRLRQEMLRQLSTGEIYTGNVMDLLDEKGSRNGSVLSDEEVRFYSRNYFCQGSCVNSLVPPPYT